MEQLPLGILSFCAGDRDCCLKSCVPHIQFCYESCKTEDCRDRCEDLVENCESVCLEKGVQGVKNPLLLQRLPVRDVNLETGQSGKAVRTLLILAGLLVLGLLCGLFMRVL